MGAYSRGNRRGQAVIDLDPRRLSRT